MVLTANVYVPAKWHSCRTSAWWFRSRQAIFLRVQGGGGDEVTPDNFREDDVLAGFTQLGGYYTK